jgi:hypothetical protein
MESEVIYLKTAKIGDILTENDIYFYVHDSCIYKNNLYLKIEKSYEIIFSDKTDSYWIKVRSSSSKIIKIIFSEYTDASEGPIEEET